MTRMSFEKRDRKLAWSQQGISLDRLAVHLTNDSDVLRKTGPEIGMESAGN